MSRRFPFRSQAAREVAIAVIAALLVSVATLAATWWLDERATSRAVAVEDARARAATVAANLNFVRDRADAPNSMPFDSMDLAGANLSGLAFPCWPFDDEPVTSRVEPITLVPEESEYDSCASFNGALLNGATLDSVAAERGIFASASISDASLNRASLRRVDAEEVVIHRSRANGVNLAGANMKRASLQDVTASGMRMDYADAENASLVRVLFGNLATDPLDSLTGSARGASFQSATWSDVSAVGVNFSDAFFYGAVLDRVDLRGSLFRGASLGGASISHVDLRSANLGGVSANGLELGAGICYDDSTIWWEGATPPEAECDWGRYEPLPYAASDGRHSTSVNAIEDVDVVLDTNVTSTGVSLRCEGALVNASAHETDFKLEWVVVGPDEREIANGRSVVAGVPAGSQWDFDLLADWTRSEVKQAEGQYVCEVRTVTSRVR